VISIQIDEDTLVGTPWNKGIWKYPCDV